MNILFIPTEFMTLIFPAIPFTQVFLTYVSFISVILVLVLMPK